MSTVPDLVQASNKSGRATDIALWSLQVLLAAAFRMAGASKPAGGEMMVNEFEAIGLSQ